MLAPKKQAAGLDKENVADQQQPAADQQQPAAAQQQPAAAKQKAPKRYSTFTCRDGVHEGPLKRNRRDDDDAPAAGFGHPAPLAVQM